MLSVGSNVQHSYIDKAYNQSVSPKTEQPKSPQDKYTPSSAPKEADITTTNTDRVDAEIQQYRAKVKELEQQLQRASGEDRQNVEAQLSKAKTELSARDNDRYRKANATYSKSGRPTSDTSGNNLDLTA